ncbi:MAG: TonB-dependent receptor plug domain-containing protein [Opitutae bacterium]|nr:TonB-dependent receptor plug domain-containing protein [Opitutae bacterium]
MGAVPVRKPYQIPAADAALSLKLFSDQSGEAIVFPVERVRGIITHAVEGAFTAREALDRMLAATPLSIVEDPTTGAFAIRPPSRTAAGASSASSSTAMNTTKKARNILQLAMLALLGEVGVAQTAPAPAPTTPAPDVKSEEMIELSPFVVNTIGDKGYGTSSGLGGTRINQALIDSSMSITNLNKEFLEDIGFTQLSDQVQFVSGMSSTGAQADGRYATRGRQSSGSNFRDGMSESFGVNSTEQVDGALFDRIEVIKGPAGVLFGQMDIGGTVNRISKRPLPTNKTTIGTSYNTLGTVRTDLDTSQVLFSNAKGKLAFRVAGAWQDGESDDGSPDDRRAINPSLQYQSNKGDTAWLYYIFQHVKSATRDTIPGDKSGKLFPFMGPGYRMFGDNSDRYDNRRIYEAGYTKKFLLFGAESAFRIVARTLDNDQDRDNGAQGNYNIFSPTGALLGTNATVLWDNITVGRMDWAGLIKSKQWVSVHGDVINTDFSTKFRLLGGQNTLFTYVEVDKQKTRVVLIETQTRPAGFARWPIFQLPPNWDNFVWEPAGGARITGNSHTAKTNQSFAIQDSISYWNNRIILTAGGRYDDGESKSRNYLTAGAPLVTSTYSNWSSKYGLVVKPFSSQTLAFFYNRSNTFLPVSTLDNNVNSPTFGKIFPHQIGEGDEYGAKVDMLNSRIVGSAVYFDSSLTNQLIDVVTPTGFTIRQPLGKVNTRGYELDLSAKVSSQITFMVAFSKLKALTLTGIPLRGNPQRTFSLVGKYSFQQRMLKGLSIVAGYRSAFKRAGDATASFYTPDLELYNLNLIYARKNWRAQISIDNLMDSTEVTGSINVARIDLYSKRNVTFKLSRSF